MYIRKRRFIMRELLGDKLYETVGHCICGFVDGLFKLMFALVPVFIAARIIVLLPWYLSTCVFLGYAWFHYVSEKHAQGSLKRIEGYRKLIAERQKY